LRPSHPLVMALALSCTTASLQEALETYAFSWAENLVQAALKSIPLGQSAGQQVLQTLCAQIPQAVADALAREDDERLVFAPMLAILSSRHESQYSRLFRS
jgi:urease accessory protein